MNQYKNIPTWQRLTFVSLVLAIAVPSAMAQLGQVNFQFQNSQGPADATIIVPVQLASFIGASTVFFRLDVDATKLDLVDVLPGVSAATANKAVSVGLDAQNRPTVLVTDFGGGMDVIPDGDLVFLVFRSASDLSIGANVPVSGADSSAATPAGSMLTTAVFGASVDIVACTTPPRPSFLAASDGTLPDRVALGWLPVPGASEYRVFRNTSNNFGTAQLIATVDIAQYDDTTAAAAMLTMGGCQGQSVAQFESFFYWVVAANACGQSQASPVDSGFRGLDTTTTRLEATPLQASGMPLIWLAMAGGYAWSRCRRSAA